jgi:hypothetical protein
VDHRVDDDASGYQLAVHVHQEPPRCSNTGASNLIETDPLRLVDRATLARRLDDILEGAPTQRPAGPERCVEEEQRQHQHAAERSDQEPASLPL